MSGYVIHVGPGLTAAEMAEAVEAGPSEVRATGSPAVLARQADLAVVEQRDATSEFRATCRTLLEVNALHEKELRQENGDEWFEEEEVKLAGLIDAIDRGLLLRTLVVLSRRK